MIECFSKSIGNKLCRFISSPICSSYESEKWHFMTIQIDKGIISTLNRQFNNRRDSFYDIYCDFGSPEYNSSVLITIQEMEIGETIKN